MPAKKKNNRQHWSKLIVPPELADLLHVIAKAKGYGRDEGHLFLYHLLKSVYPDDVERFADYMQTRWLDAPPTGDED